VNDSIVNPINGLNFAPEWVGTNIHLKSLPIADYTAALFPEERLLVEEAGELRRRTFSTGRICIRQLLNDIGDEPGALLKSTDGSIVWPEDRIGSLTHTNTWAVSAVAIPEMSGARAVGIDLETIKPLAPRVMKHIATAAELQVLRQGPEVAWSGSAIFSLKESVYKCLRPSFGNFIRFHDVEIADLLGGRPRLRIPGNALARHCSAIDIELRLAVTADHVFSLAWWRS